MPKDHIPKPACFDKLMNAVSRLGKGIPVARIDMYVCGEKIYFGEMTFYHFGGMVPFVPEEWDYKFGEWLTLPKTIVK